MANIKVIGDAMVVTSTLKMEDIELLQRLDSNALIATDEYDEPVYTVLTGYAGLLDKHGVRFTSADKNGFATMTLLLPPMSNAKREEYIKENYAMAIAGLNRMESILEEYIKTFKDRYNAAMSAVEFIDNAADVEADENVD